MSLIIFITTAASFLGLRVALDRSYNFSTGLRVLIFLLAVFNLSITVLALMRLSE